jgi:hypothetical protein
MIKIGDKVKHKKTNAVGICLGHPEDFLNEKLWYVKWNWQKQDSITYIYSEVDLIKL